VDFPLLKIESFSIFQ